ncbi:MAG: ABC transporter substrate-binding protein [Alphaproteobacteria bacterium]|nr:ABC transporter substrate-binding protein [Alphaproteobacteria bacterium]
MAVGVSALTGGVAEAQTSIKVGVAQSSIGTLPLLTAEQNGYFADEQIEVETFQFRGGAPAVQALASGSIDICVCAGDHAVRLRSRGLPAKIIAGLTERHGYAMLALGTSEVSGLGDLLGKRLGITSPGSLTDNSARYVLSDLGIDPDRDLTFASIGVGIPMKAALDTGAIDVGLFTTPDVQAVMAGGDYKIIHDFRTWGYTALDLIARERFLNSNGDHARAFLRAVIRAQDLLHVDAVALENALTEMYPTFDAALIEQLVVDVPESLARGGEVSQDGYNRMIMVLGAVEPELSEIPYGDVVTRAYLPVP